MGWMSVRVRIIVLGTRGRSDREENDTNSTTYLVEYIPHDVLGWEGVLRYGVVLPDLGQKHTTVIHSPISGLETDFPFRLSRNDTKSPLTDRGCPTDRRPTTFP